MKRLARRLASLGLFLLVGALALGAHAWFVWSPGAPAYAVAAERAATPLPERFRDGPEHDRVRAEHPEPYVLELARASGGALLYYGAHHSDDPADAQLAD